MQAPLDPEVANADLITDIVAPTLDRSSDVSDLARDLTVGSDTWRDAWSVGPKDPSPSEDGAQVARELSYDEDAELRRLNYLAEIGTLTGVKAERLIELRLRDRRNEVRAPRESAEERDGARSKRRWHRFGS